MFEILRIKWALFGIDAPAFIWIAAVALILMTIIFAIRLFIKVRQQVTLFREASEHIKAQFTEGSSETDAFPDGASDERIKAVGKYLSKSKSRALVDSWIDYRSHLVPQQRENNEIRYWSAIAADSIFSEKNLIDESLNRDLYRSLPGIITGFGLLLTFLAILVALLDVRLLDNRVQGLELLIQGLSGKFITSVVALLLATLFIFFEKNRFHKLEKSHIGLASAIDRTIPQISSVKVLVDLKTEIAELRVGIKKDMDQLNEHVDQLNEHVDQQTVCIRDFNTSLAPMLQQTFDESMTPTLNRMVVSIEELNTFLRAAEASRNDSITDSVHELLGNLQTSLTGSISEMGGKFNESLTGSAQQQFESISTSLSNTTALLDGMNSQFASSQTAMQEMINIARTTTEEQMTMSQGQASMLSETMGMLMTGLADRVNELGQQMSDAVQTNSEQAVGAAEKVLDRADEWSTANAERLTKLLETHDSQLEKVIQTRDTLDAIVKKFNSSLEGLVQVSHSSQESVLLIAKAVGSMNSAAENAATTHQKLQVISDLTANQLHDFDHSVQNQKEVWESIFQNLKNYESTFRSVETSAAALLEQIGSNLENYQQVCESGFNNLVEISDEHFANATQRLGNSVSELDEVLVELNESFARIEGLNNNGIRE